MGTKNKTCAFCNQKLSITKYYKSSRQKDGYDYYCKECRKAGSLKSHRGGKRKPLCTLEGCETPNYAGGMCKMHYERNRRTGSPTLKNFGRDSYNGQPYSRVRELHLKRRFKITPEEYITMAANGCEICGRLELPHKKLHIDHDWNCCPAPKTSAGKYGYYNTCGQCVRGVLCDRCNGNVGLFERGKLRDDYPDRDKIITYVAKYNQVISDRMVSYDKKQRNR